MSGKPILTINNRNKEKSEANYSLWTSRLANDKEEFSKKIYFFKLTL